jgi:hypothetical protein
MTILMGAGRIEVKRMLTGTRAAQGGHALFRPLPG